MLRPALLRRSDGHPADVTAPSLLRRTRQPPDQLDAAPPGNRRQPGGSAPGLTEARGVDITVFSYHGFLDVGIVVDRGMVPDVWGFIDYMRDAFAEL